VRPEALARGQPDRAADQPDADERQPHRESSPPGRIAPWAITPSDASAQRESSPLT
jgi:hypothetical protein